jgi:hypothetical protein
MVLSFLMWFNTLGHTGTCRQRHIHTHRRARLREEDTHTQFLWRWKMSAPTAAGAWVRNWSSWNGFIVAIVNKLRYELDAERARRN